MLVMRFSIMKVSMDYLASDLNAVIEYGISRIPPNEL